MKIPRRVVFHCRYGMILIVLSWLLASCKLSAPAASKPTQSEPDAIFTAAAQTAEARRFERLTQTAAKAPIEPTIQIPVETSTEIPTLAPLGTPAETPNLPPPADTLAIPMTSTLPTATIVAVPPTDVAATPGKDKAEFIEDVNVPDGTSFPPGKHFQKTWKIENIGKTTWTTEYALVFIDGTLMGAASVVSLPQKVSPWEKVSVTIDMVAPATPGKYTGYWKLRNASGQIFGFGATGDEAIWVQINVESSLASGLSALSQEATSIATENQVVSAVTLSVDNPAVSGCPHTFLLTALINLNKAATVTYSLEGGDNTGYPLKLPIPATRNLDAGAHPIIYELTFAKDLTGWMRLRITQPEQFLSEQVNFSLTCG